MSADAPTEPVPAPLPRGNLPRLRIHHVLVCMAVAGALFLSTAAYLRVSSYPWGLTLHTIGLILDAAAITCLAFGVAWWWRGKRFPSQPGHGLLMWQIPQLIFVLQMIVLAEYFRPANFEGQFHRVLDPARPNIIRWLENWSEVAIGGVAMLVCVVCLIWFVRSLEWRLLFAVVAAESLIHVVVTTRLELFGRSGIRWSDFFEYAALRLLPAAIVVLALLFAVSIDVWKHASRHWSHWCGVVVCFLQTSITIFVFAPAAWREW